MINGTADFSPWSFAWSPDGSTLAASGSQPSAHVSMQLWFVDASNADPPQQLTHFEVGTWPSAPSWRGAP